MKLILFSIVSMLFLISGISSVLAQSFSVEIRRTSYNTKSITGELYVRGKLIAHTLELPWRNNESYVSSIPQGEYSAILRYDKNDKWRLQLENVPGRSGIQIHIGNFPSEIEGCVLIGQKVINIENKIEKSGDAYRILKEEFYGDDSPISTPDVSIKVSVKYYPSRTSFTSNESGGGTFSYRDAGKWDIDVFGSHSILNEVARDLDYIYMRTAFENDNSFIRVPIQGGIYQASESLNGPWSGGPQVVRKH